MTRTVRAAGVGGHRFLDEVSSGVVLDAVVGGGPHAAEIELSHDQTDGTDVRIGRQWLLPTATTPAVGTPTRLLFDGDHITATAAAATLSVTTGAVDTSDATASAPPATVALPDGRVAAWHNDRLILAYPFGGTATPQPPAKPPDRDQEARRP